MIANGLFDYHPLLADWLFLLAALAFLALAGLAIARARPRPADGRSEASSDLRAALPWLASALVAFGLLVL
jgi:hypothetical protein